MHGMSYPEIKNGLPDITPSSEVLAMPPQRRQKIYIKETPVQFNAIRSVAAIALHMHQPLIPAGGPDLHTADVISNLQYMMENQGIGDNHNAPVFHWCYKRMGEFIPSLIDEGKQPRVMLEYSGTLLYGLRKMGLNDVFDNLRKITLEPRYRFAVEWLGCPWGHAVAPSTPVNDYPKHIVAWRKHFLSLFGAEALERVRGFSPSEMALPNHPDAAYSFVKSLLDNGFTWVLVQEHTVENPDGSGLQKKHIPHVLRCTNSEGKHVEITAIIKTQGSDTKLVAQMQPYYEAKSLSRWEIGGKSIPPLVTQIADGENGGVMMNEFPPKYFDVVRESSNSDTLLMNVTEYLEHLESLDISSKHFPVIQPLFQSRIWNRFKPGSGEERLKTVIQDLKKEDSRFHMEGGSWTNNISWTKGYENMLGPMEQFSSTFNEKIIDKELPASDERYREALFYLLTSQTSCYRYWGQGTWTDYGSELVRRGMEILKKI
jgi:hypothetical protein